MLKEITNKLLGKLGLRIVKASGLIPNLFSTLDNNDKEFIAIYKKCKPYTMTRVERMYSLYKAIQYIVNSKILGDIVECGVWRGGSSMLIAHTLMLAGDTSRNIYLYDTYAGMTLPGNDDIDWRGVPAIKQWAYINKWTQAGIDEVKNNLSLTGYPKDKLIFVKGDVKETIPGTTPKIISLLRLDTDWFESTYHEMCHLFRLLALNGVLIIDDYGYWKGAKRAVDKYIGDNNINILLNNIDSESVIGVKCAPKI